MGIARAELVCPRQMFKAKPQCLLFSILAWHFVSTSDMVKRCRGPCLRELKLDLLGSISNCDIPKTRALAAIVVAAQTDWYADSSLSFHFFSGSHRRRLEKS